MAVGQQVFTYLRRVSDYFMFISDKFYVIITRPSIRLYQATGMDQLLDRNFKVVRRCTFYAFQSNPSNGGTLCFYSNNNKRFPLCTTPSFANFFATYIGFINFDDARKIVSTRGNHRSSKFVKPSPGSFVTAQSHNSFNRYSTCSILLACHPPDGPKPKYKGFMGSVKNSPRYYRYFIMTTRAFIQTIFVIPSFIMRTSRTAKTIWPSQIEQILMACILGAKSLLKFHNCLRVIFHYPINYI